jgi:hypothetical protein
MDLADLPLTAMPCSTIVHERRSIGESKIAGTIPAGDAASAATPEACPRSWPQKLAEAAKATWLYNAQRSTTVTYREFSTRGKPTGAGVEVRDSGTGLDSAALDRLFDAFYTTGPMAWAWG